MDYFTVMKSGESFRSLSDEELFETSGGRIIPIGIANAYYFMSALVRNLLKKEDEK